MRNYYKTCITVSCILATLFMIAGCSDPEIKTIPVTVNGNISVAEGVNGDGVVHIAWLDRRGRDEAGQDIFYATAVDGAVGKNTKVAETVCECCAPGLAVDAASPATDAASPATDTASPATDAAADQPPGNAEIVLRRGCACALDQGRLAPPWPWLVLVLLALGRRCRSSGRTHSRPSRP